MTRKATLQDIRDQRRVLNDIRDWRREDSQRLLDAWLGRLRTRIGAVTHGHDGKGGMPRTLCGIRRVPNVMNPPTFPQGFPTDDEVDCMTCLVRGARL